MFRTNLKEYRRGSVSHVYSPCKIQRIELTNFISEEELLQIVCDGLVLPIEEVKKKSRSAEMVRARAIYFYLGSLIGFKWRAMGDIVDQSHCTALHHANNVKDLLDQNKKYHDHQLFELVEYIKRRLSVRAPGCLPVVV
jgi:chromosomal replication initiation ATPase DnaA